MHQNHLIRMAIITLPFWHPIGLSLVMLPLICLLSLFMRTIDAAQHRLSNPVSWVLCLLAIILTFSSIFNYISNGFTFQRLVGALHNAMYWFLGAWFTYLVARNLTIENFRVLSRAASVSLFILLWMSAFTLIVFYLNQNQVLTIPTFVGLFVNNLSLPDLLRQTLQWKLYSNATDFGFLFPRLVLVGPYANIYASLLAGLTLLAWPTMMEMQRPKLYLLLTVILICLTFSASRTVILSLILCISCLLWMSSRMHFKLILFCLVPAVAIAVWMLFDIDQVQSLDFRSGSTDTRFFLYALTLEAIAENNVFIGAGYKPLVLDFFNSLSLGSHSTPLSIAMRGGLFGMLLWLTIQIYLVISSVRGLRAARLMALKNRPRNHISAIVSASLYILMFCFIQLTEDVDANGIIAFAYFLSVGLAVCINRHVTRSIFAS